MYGEARSALRKALNLLAESGAIDVWRLWVCLKIFRTWGIHAQCMAILMVNITYDQEDLHTQMAMVLNGDKAD